MTEARTQNEGCAEFQERMPQLFELKVDFSNEDHLKTCDNCAELVRDLQYIAQQAGMLMPIHDPGPAVWERISSAIQSTPEAGKAR